MGRTMEGPKPVEDKGDGRYMLESMFGVERGGMMANQALPSASVASAL